MPHLTLEYTNNLPEPIDFDSLFKKMHRALVEISSIQIGNIKSRAIAYNDYLIGDGAPENIFVHLTVAIWAGRPLDQQKQIGERLLMILRDAFGSIFAARPCDITIEIREMRRETYFKAVSNTA